MRKRKPLVFSEHYIAAVLFNKIVSDEAYLIVGKGYHWETLVFYPHTGLVVYKGTAYTIEQPIADLFLIKLEIKILKNER